MKPTEKTNTKKSRIRKGDFVIVISGEGSERDKNNNHIIRRVLAVYPKADRVLVEGVNMRKRSYKKGANPTAPDGGIHDKTMPIHISNVMLVDPKEKTPTRVGVRLEQGSNGETRRVRYAKASGADFTD